MQLISFFGQSPPSLAFLDFGMGWADWALMAKAFGCDSYGTELSRKRVEHATANGIQVISWDQIPEYRFDFINTEQVFEHISEPLNTLRHLAGSLKSTGMLKIAVPTAGGIERKLRRMDWAAPTGSEDSLMPVAPLEHINCYRRSTLVRMAQEAGMEEVRMPSRIQCEYRTDWLGPKQIAKNLLRPLLGSLVQRDDRIYLRNAHPAQTPPP